MTCILNYLAISSSTLRPTPQIIKSESKVNQIWQKHVPKVMTLLDAGNASREYLTVFGLLDLVDQEVTQVVNENLVLLRIEIQLQVLRVFVMRIPDHCWLKLLEFLALLLHQFELLR